MGQRLNIEIVDINGEGIVNAYYHWSGFTSSSLELLQQVISYYKDNKEKFIKNGELDKTLLAIRMLESTGAGIDSSEIEQKIISEKYPQETFQIGKDRNDGLINISEDGMNETRNCEEARIDVNIDTGYVNFMVYMEADNEILSYEVDPDGEVDEDMLDKVIQNYIDNAIDIGKDLTYDISGVPFEKVEEFSKVISDASDIFKYKGSMYSKIE